MRWYVEQICISIQYINWIKIIIEQIWIVLIYHDFFQLKKVIDEYLMRTQNRKKINWVQWNEVEMGKCKLIPVKK